MKTILPGLDDSRSPYPALVPSKYGFPSASLKALYLMTGQYTPGEVITSGQVNDVSGNLAHADYQAGGVATQRGWGQSFVDNGGGIISPYAVNAGSFTVFVTVQQTYGEGPATARYPVYYASSTMLGASTAIVGSPTENGLYLTQVIDDAEAGQLDLGIFVKNPVIDGAPRKGIIRDLVSSMSFHTMACSVNFTTNVINFVSSAGSYSIVNADAVDLVQAATGYHSFGLFRLDAEPLPGSLCLAGLLDVALPMTELQALYKNARSIVRKRGVEVV